MTNQNTAPESPSTEYQDSIKAAAKRMCASLGAKGHKVPHTAMLEAIAEGLGLDNWRTLKAVIDAPRAKPEPEAPALPALGEWQRWVVNGIYVDNDQQYGDEFEGRTPLEGAINALMDRLTDFGNVIHICDVSDANRVERLSPSFITEISLARNETALRTLLAECLRLHWAKPVADHTADWKLSLAWLQAQVAGVVVAPKVSFMDQGVDAFEHLTDWHTYEQQQKATGTKPAPSIAPGSSLTAAQALELLCSAVEQSYGGVVPLETLGEDDDKLCAMSKQLYQLRAMCGYFEAVVNDPDFGFDELDWADGAIVQL